MAKTGANATKPISDALQLDDTLRLSNGTELPVLGACKLRDLEHVMELYNKFVSANVKFAGLYTEHNKDARDAFEELLYILVDRKTEKDELLDMLTTADEAEVYKALHRFLGFITRNDAEEKAQAQQE